MDPIVKFPPVVSVSPITLEAPGRDYPLQVRASAPAYGEQLPVIVFSHGFGSSMDAYAPLVNYWAARGFVVIQPTFLDSGTISPDHKPGHSEAIQAYLQDPRKPMMWRYRVEDVRRVLDQLDMIGNSVPGLQGRIDQSRIAAIGHSFGAQTAAALLGTRVIYADGSLSEDMRDHRIKAGVLLSAGGRGGEALSPFANEHFPHLNQSYAEMITPTLVVAGDRDESPLTTMGPEWFTDAYKLSPGANSLVTLIDGEHMLGGISGYLVTETTDENPDRVKAVQQLTTAYLQSVLYPGDPAWSLSCNDFQEHPDPKVQIINKPELL